MPHIKEYRWRLAHHLKASRQRNLSQYSADFRVGQFQAQLDSRNRSSRQAVYRQTICRQRYLVAGICAQHQALARPAQLVAVTRSQQPYPLSLCLLQYRWRRIEIRIDGSLAMPEDAGFFKSDGVPVIAQP